MADKMMAAIDFGMTDQAVYMFALDQDGNVLAWNNYLHDPNNEAQNLLRASGINPLTRAELPPLDRRKWQQGLPFPDAETMRRVIILQAGGDPDAINWETFTAANSNITI